MHAVRMQFSGGACCATGELCGFSHFPEEWFKGDRWSRNGPRTLQSVDPYNHRALAQQGWSKSSTYLYGQGDTVEQAWQNCLKAAQAQVDGYSYKGSQLRYFWFVKYRGDDEGYQNEPLRQIVANAPGVVKLGEYVNANSTNTVDGYMMVFENANGEEPEDDDDE